MAEVVLLMLSAPSLRLASGLAVAGEMAEAPVVRAGTDRSHLAAHRKPSLLFALLPNSPMSRKKEGEARSRGTAPLTPVARRPRIRESGPPHRFPGDKTMRILKWYLAFALLAAGRLHAQQSVDDLIAKYAQRIGGAERLHSIQSVRRIGKFYGGGGFEARLTNENKRPNKVREEFEFGGM